MNQGPAPQHHWWQALRDWVMVAWALWWSWAYIEGALAHRFPQLLGWVHRLF
jgi:hypothetical protein